MLFVYTREKTGIPKREKKGLFGINFSILKIMFQNFKKNNPLPTPLSPPKNTKNKTKTKAKR